MMKYKYLFGLVAISWISLLEITAMYNNINGQSFATAIAAICAISAGLLGYGLGSKNKDS